MRVEVRASGLQHRLTYRSPCASSTISNPTLSIEFFNAAEDCRRAGALSIYSVNVPSNYCDRIGSNIRTNALQLSSHAKLKNNYLLTKLR